MIRHLACFALLAPRCPFQEGIMKCRVASLGVLAGLVVVACGESPQPTEPVAIEPSFNVSGSTTQCVGGLTGGPYENVEVPPHGSCFIFGAVIRGSVKALQHADLNIQRTQVGGNVEGDKAEFVQVGNFTIVNGSIIIKEGISISSACGAAVDDAVVGEGNIQVEKLTTQCIAVRRVQMGKGNIKVEENNVNVGSFVGPSFLDVRDNVGAVDIQIFKNRGTAPKTVSNNQARLLQCFENDLPFLGGPNPATPQKEGQCF
jgi:hypothetical protein